MKTRKGYEIIWNKEKKIIKRKTYNIYPIELEQATAEQIFKINLENRNFYIDRAKRQVTITFFDRDNIFGWLESLAAKEFNKRLKTI